MTSTGRLAVGEPNMQEFPLSESQKAAARALVERMNGKYPKFNHEDYGVFGKAVADAIAAKEREREESNRQK